MDMEKRIEQFPEFLAPALSNLELDIIHSTGNNYKIDLSDRSHTAHLIGCYPKSVKHQDITLGFDPVYQVDLELSIEYVLTKPSSNYHYNLTSHWFKGVLILTELEALHLWFNMVSPVSPSALTRAKKRNMKKALRLNSQSRVYPRITFIANDMLYDTEQSELIFAITKHHAPENDAPYTQHQLLYRTALAGRYFSIIHEYSDDKHLKRQQTLSPLTLTPERAIEWCIQRDLVSLEVAQKLNLPVA